MRTEKEETDSLDSLYKDFKEGLVRFACTYVRDVVVAEDITIEAMMLYWERKQELPGDTNVPGYILTIVKNKCLNHLRHLQVCEEYADRQKTYYEWELNTRISTLQACEPYELFADEIRTLVQDALAGMPEKTRRIFMMNRFEGLSYKEIAAAMNLSYKSVDFHICKALKLLQTSLRDYFPLFFYIFLRTH